MNANLVRETNTRNAKLKTRNHGDPYSLALSYLEGTFFVYDFYAYKNSFFLKENTITTHNIYDSSSSLSSLGLIKMTPMKLENEEYIIIFFQNETKKRNRKRGM